VLERLQRTRRLPCRMVPLPARCEATSPATHQSLYKLTIQQMHAAMRIMPHHGWMFGIQTLDGYPHACASLRAGFWGGDCAYSMGSDGKVEVLSGMGYVPRKKRPWVYVYDLPHRLTTWYVCASCSLCFGRFADT
jgi:hypothetical protein